MIPSGDQGNVKVVKRRMKRALLLACALCLPGYAAIASGSETFRNGAALSWYIGAEKPERRLGVTLPSFVEWAASSFDAPIIISLSSNYIAAIDQWELAFYRVGDHDRLRPLRVFRGDALDLHTPLSWSGGIDDGPPLRPGETLNAVLTVRDTAGNIDRTEPQSLLVARFQMRHSARQFAAENARRERIVDNGLSLSDENIPLVGNAVRFKLSKWPGSDEPMLSGSRLFPDGKRWEMEQILPGGWYDLVGQSARPIIGGTRAIPVGTSTLGVPDVAPLISGVKGVGSIDKLNRSTADMFFDGYGVDGVVEGSDAIGLMMTNRMSPEDRRAVSEIDPVSEVTLLKDDRNRRYIASENDANLALWAGLAARPAPKSDIRPVSTVTINAIYKLDRYAELHLPHSDVERSSVRVLVGAEGIGPIEMKRPLHYSLNHAEGRIKLTPQGQMMLSDISAAETEITVRYAVARFGVSDPRGFKTIRVQRNGASLVVTNAQQDSDGGAHESVPRKRGLFSYLSNLIFGGGDG